MVLPKLKSSNLISIGQLCDDGCSILLDKAKMLAFKNNKLILKGFRNKSDGLWDIPIKKTTITKHCCHTPILHGGISLSTTTKENKVEAFPKTSSGKSNAIPHHLQQLSNLALSNEDFATFCLLFFYS